MADTLRAKDFTDPKQYLEHCKMRIGGLKAERTSFESHWKECAEFIGPRRGRFFVDDRNKGDKRYKSIINSRGTMALRKASAGMLAGAMSPSRPWFRFSTFDPDVSEGHKAKIWLALLARIVLLVLAKSNFYNMAPIMLKELLLFGTGCLTHVDDHEDIARFYAHTIGSYWIGQSDRFEVNTLVRQFQMNADQMITRFGEEKVSSGVKSDYARSNWSNWHNVTHFVEPNPVKDGKKLLSRFKNFRSVYFQPDKTDGFLSDMGFDAFPAYVPRWELTNEDIYGTDCPGMICLGDIKELQFQEKEKAKATAKSNTPPLQGPPSIRNQPVANLPGGVTVNTGSATGGKIEPLYKVDPHTQEMMLDIQRIERRIDEIFFVDLFMAITEMEGIQPKNELQLSQINQERLLQLGPVLEQIHGEWLGKMVLRIAQKIITLDIMPDPPEELQGQVLDIVFISALAVAQRSIATSGIERGVSFMGMLMQNGWDVMDKLDADATIDEYADLVGMPMRLVVPSPEAMRVRQERMQQQQQEKQMMMAQQMANVAKMASDAKLSDDNVLSSAVGRK